MANTPAYFSKDGVKTLKNALVESKPGTISIIVAESQRIYVAGLKSIFANSTEFDIVGVVSSFEALQTMVIVKKPSRVLLDEALLARRADRLQWMVRTYPLCRLIVEVNTEDRDFTLGLLHAGARAVIPRLIDPIELVRRIKAVVVGHYSISDTVQQWLIDDWHNSRKTLGVCTLPTFNSRETIVVSMVLTGHKNSEIALQIGTTVQTIKNILNRLYKRLQVNDRAGFRKCCESLGVASGAR
jgi:DNA-binding NarL/FixJ family response regulator